MTLSDLVVLRPDGMHILPNDCHLAVRQTGFGFVAEKTRICRRFFIVLEESHYMRNAMACNAYRVNIILAKWFLHSKGFDCMAEDIPIITGDPLEKKDGASFTTFVLPFRYQPSLVSFYDADDILKSNKPYYKSIEMHSPDWVNRMRYFTSETARVLYDHARWFELSESNWKDFEWGNKAFSEKIFNFYNEHGKKINVRFHPPRLILFEWRDVKTVSVDADEDHKQNRDWFDTGFLIIKASFEADDRNPSYRDLLYFNELFRYWRMPFTKHQWKMRMLFGNHFDGKPEGFYLQRWSELLRIPFQISPDKALYSLFPRIWNDVAEAWWSSEASDLIRTPSPHANARMDNAGWICYADNRTFVWSCAVVESGVKALEKMGNTDNETLIKLGGWIKFLNVDQPGKINWINEATPFEKEWVKKRYYDRWLHFGTLYGFNYHAGVMLTKPCDEPPIGRHFHDQYLDMTLLLLYLRITLFRFSGELTRLSADMRRSKTTNFWTEFRINLKHRKEFKVLRREFAVFTNLYQFPLISNQQQAIEMYDLIRKRMDVQELFKEVEEEIKSSHEYFQFLEESNLNKLILVLTVVSIFVAIASIPNAIELFTQTFSENEQVKCSAFPCFPSPKTP